MESKELNARGNFISDCCQQSSCLPTTNQPTTNDLETPCRERDMIQSPFSFTNNFTNAHINTVPSLESQLKDLQAQIEIVQLKIKLAKLEHELDEIRNKPIITYPTYPTYPNYPTYPTYPFGPTYTCESESGLPRVDLSDIASATSKDVGETSESVCKRIKEMHAEKVFDINGLEAFARGLK